MAEKSLAQKMKLKPDAQAAIINAPQGYIKSLGHNKEILQTLNGQFDWIQIFVKTQGELATLAPNISKSLKPGSMIWLSFPKGSSKIQTDLTRDKGWNSLRTLNLKWIALISVNETWSAFSMRPYKEGEEKQSFRL